MTQTLEKEVAKTNLLPLSAFVLKIASRCNLNCSYCYMYNLLDKTYKDQPMVMAQVVVDAVIAKTKKHALDHGLTRIDYIFHGGEPLLAGEEFFRYFVATANSAMLPEITPVFALQTNATLLNEKWLELFEDLSICIGVSLDGDKETNDANRVDHQGKGSYDKVASALKLIQSRPKTLQNWCGILTVINVNSDAVNTYEHFRELSVGAVDLRLPDATHDNPPPEIGSGATPYADWLIPIFDKWFQNPDSDFQIRLFENVIGLVFGSQRTTEDVGGKMSNFAVIETNGGIEPPGALKACEEGLTKVGLNILTHDIDDVYSIPLFATFLSGADNLCATCKSCPVVSVCGAGKFAHRYSSERKFDNPSVYCEDLKKLITHIQRKTVEALPSGLRSQMRLTPLIQVEE
ncbi:MAG: radical SAM protein [Cyanobacteria bacterium DS2.3.42]|nr:radical SAM protein [Cyanobacteria bacterium DS2.3.42]